MPYVKSESSERVLVLEKKKELISRFLGLATDSGEVFPFTPFTLSLISRGMKVFTSGRRGGKG